MPGGPRKAVSPLRSATALQSFASWRLGALALFLVPLWLSAATNDLTSTLQRGLFEEEANHNLEAAAQAYQAVSARFDQDRKLAATAIFRLGEVYRKQGKTNEAVAQYERIVREFSDQPTLATLSRQNLAGLRESSASFGDVVMLTQPGNASEEASRLAAQLKGIEQLKDKPEEQARAVLAFFPDETLKKMLLQLPKLQKQEATVRENPTLQYDKLSEKLAEKIGYRPAGNGSSWHAAYSPDGLEPERHGTNFVTDAQRELTKQLSWINERVAFAVGVQKARLQVLQATVANTPAREAAADQAATADEDEEKEIRRIQAMIQNSPDLINAASGDLRLTPLVAAATKGQTRVASFLLDHGADVNLPSTASTPLGAAVANGHKAMTELLLSRGADLNGKCYRDQTALHIAAEKGFRAVAEVLLANQAQLEARTDKGYTPLHLAVQRGVNSLVQFLVSKGANANAEDNDGVTVLSHALSSSKPELLKTLLAAKADSNAGKANLPLLVALRYGDLATLEELLRAGADANKEGRVKWEVNTGGSIYQGGTTVTPLWLAVSANKPEAVKLLLKHKADPNGKNPSGKPILLDALANTNVLSALLEAGASPDANDGQGGCALLTAVWTSNSAAVELLLAHEAKVNVRSADGRAPLDYAVDREDNKSVALLLSAKAEVNTKTAAGLSALHLAANQGSKGIVEMLLANGADVNLKNKEGETALHWAVRIGNRGMGSQELVGLLLAKGADPNIRNDQGLTPLDLTKSENVAPGVGFAGFGTRPGLGLPPPPPVPSGAPGVPTRALRQPASSTTTVKPEPASVAELLRQHGARDDLPKLDRIEVRRPAANYSATIFMRGKQDWNQHTLLELIAVEYGLLAVKREQTRYVYESNYFKPWTVKNERRLVTALQFPDFRNVIIRRPTTDGMTRDTVKVDLAALLQSGDCTRDVPLHWGDVVEIAESDHQIDEQWTFPAEALKTLKECLTRKVTISVKDQTMSFTLAPFMTLENGALKTVLSNRQLGLLPVLEESKLLRNSSDLSRIKVTRREAGGGTPREWVVDRDATPDLWLRDGDAIEVPDKP